MKTLSLLYTKAGYMAPVILQYTHIPCGGTTNLVRIGINGTIGVQKISVTSQMTEFGHPAEDGMLTTGSFGFAKKPMQQHFY